MEELTTQQNTIEDTNQMYIDEINNLKASTVSREKYDKLMQENKNLLTSLVNGNPTSTEEEPTYRTAAEIRPELRKEMTNLDFCKTALELREAVLREEGKDIFVGRGHDIVPTNESYESAEKVATVMQECIEYANGDSQVFTNELMRRTNDINLPRYR